MPVLNHANLTAIFRRNPGKLRPFFLSRFDFPIVERLTDLERPATWRGEVYSPNSKQVKFDKPISDLVTTTDRYQFTLNYLSFSQDLDELPNRDVQIVMGFKEPDGTPNLGDDDCLFLYKGKVSSVSLVTSDSTADLVISCTAPLPGLDSVSPHRTSPSHQRQVDPNDGAFDEISDSVRELTSNWGVRL